MLRRFSIFCAVLFAMAVAAGQASADLLLSARGPGGSNDVVLMPGEEVNLTVSVTVTEPFAGFLLYAGGDFQIGSGSDATFHGTEYLLTGAGAWTAVPPEGGTTRFFTGGPASTQVFTQVGQTLDLGRIVLRAGGPGTFTTTFDLVNQLNSDFLPINTATSGFTYTVGVPEPSSALLLGLAGTGLVFRRRRS